ncbi:unnamed protein product [Brugia timori]|uniref:Uncharacterized protein n=1 Tax=Brugia timori TaxID=42155 RepID=A0A0R3QA64_9BILA|nr:unnamed protein product [Brugia timori]
MINLSDRNVIPLKKNQTQIPIYAAERFKKVQFNENQ